MKNTSRRAHHVSVVHRNITPLINMSNAQTSINKCIFKGKGAANHERHQIVTPNRGNVRQFLLQNAIFEHPVFGGVSTNVNVIEHKGTSLYHMEQRTWLGISLTKEQKVKCIFFWKDTEVGLCIAWTLPSSLTLKRSFAARKTKIYGGRKHI
jgi:hypothetical protein